MIQKHVLVAERVRRPPSTGWSWMDRRFVREYVSHLSREAALLYFFLAAVSDRQGLSFYSDASTAALLRMPLETLVRARDELVQYDLIAYQPPLSQVLSMPSSRLRRRVEPGQGLLRIGELLQLRTPSPASSVAPKPRSLP